MTWKVKLNNEVWLSEDGTTTNEAEAWLLPDMPSVHAELKKARRFMPYKEAMVIYDDKQQRTSSQSI